MRINLCLLLMIGMILSISTGLYAQLYPVPADRDVMKDSDGDGYLDGYNVWKDGVLYKGECVFVDVIQHIKRPDVFLYGYGADGARSSWDDGSDPEDSESTPLWYYKVHGTYERPKQIKDTDGDGIADIDEDLNGNGLYEPNQDETNWNDADSDDDGLSDGLEAGGMIWGSDYLYCARYPYVGFSPANVFNPRDPDTDGDGLPDGLEMGIRSPLDGLPDGMAYMTPPRVKDTDVNATFTWQGMTRKCFIPDQDLASITDPRNSDTNLDGIHDGKQDLNANGRVDDGETDPAVGWMAFTAQCVLGDLKTSHALELEAPLIVDGVVDPNGKEYHLWELCYQSSLLDPKLFEADSIKMSCPNALKVKSIIPIPGKRYYEIILEWNQASDEPFDVWIESPALAGGRTESLRVITHP